LYKVSFYFSKDGFFFVVQYTNSDQNRPIAQPMFRPTCHHVIQSGYFPISFGTEQAWTWTKKIYCIVSHFSLYFLIAALCQIKWKQLIPAATISHVMACYHWSISHCAKVFFLWKCLHLLNGLILWSLCQFCVWIVIIIRLLRCWCLCSK
jgi:hypothetical protein